MSTSQVYTRHPLLANPLKWLRGVKKRHTPDLYLDSYYEPKYIASNPFFTSLASARQDVSKCHFPIGNMIQMVVKSTEDAQKQEHVIHPVLRKPQNGQNPARYVIGNKDYISFLMRRRFLPVPVKLQHRSSSIVRQISISKTFAEDVELLLRTSFTALLTHYKPKQICHGRGILLKPSSTLKFEWDYQTPVVYTDLVESETFLDYTEDMELCSIIIKVLRYLKTSP